jgi:hypothetical protein
MADQPDNISARKVPQGAGLMRPEEPVDKDRVHVIDITTIRISSGVLWERTYGGTLERLKSILIRLVPSATCELIGTDHTRCVVTIADIAPDEAAAACVRAAHELITGLLGRCGIGDIHVSRADGDSNGGLHQRRIGADEVKRIIEGGGPIGQAPAQPPRRGAAHAMDGERTKDASLGAPAPTRKISAGFGFKPMWEARSETVCMYRCAPAAITTTDDPTAEIAFEDLSTKELMSVELDGLLVGIEALSRCVASGDLSLLNVPISFESLSSPVGRNDISQICRGVLPIYRQFMTFTLRDVPPAVSAARLSDLVMLLRPFGFVIATVPPGGRNYGTYLNIGLAGIALELPRGQTNNTRLHGDILHLAAAGRRFKMGAALYGIEGPDIISLAHAADVRLFQGAAIGELVDAPRRMTHRPRSAIIPEAQNAGEEDWF